MIHLWMLKVFRGSDSSSPYRHLILFPVPLVLPESSIFDVEGLRSYRNDDDFILVPDQTVTDMFALLRFVRLR